MTSRSTNGTNDRLDEIIAGYVRAVEDGERPDRAKLLADHADLEDDLRDFFRHRDRMEQLLDPLRSAAARVLNVRCPHCRNSIELVDDTIVSSINCPSCGSQFSLVGDRSTYRFPGGLKRIGQFQLVDHVGTGQFGTVWKAKDLALERTVAIKIPRHRQLEQGEAEMFLRDARTAAQLKHPNIVGVHEVGKHDDMMYIVSDFIQGATLKQWITTKPLSQRGIAQLTITIAEALHHAHEMGVVHRDLKPGNIMMDLAGQPHIVDFGLAKRDSGEITMTMDGQILGSPAYMPPEQARGEGHSVDRRGDIYSLGVLLYELLTGELPFRGDKQMLIVQILNDEPPSLRKLNGDVPRDLETICLKCLRKQPGQRYQTTEDLAADLQRWLDHQPIAARPSGPHERFWFWCRRRPTIAALIAVLLAVLVGSVFAAREVQQRERARRLVAQLASADVALVPNIIEQLRVNHYRAVPLLRVSEAQLPPENKRSQRRTHLALFQLTGEQSLVQPLLDHLLVADPPEFANLIDALRDGREDFVEQLWTLAFSRDERTTRRFRACCALASLAPADDRWTEIAGFTAGELAAAPPQDFAGWAAILQPARQQLLPPLHTIFTNSDEQDQHRNFAAYSLATFHQDDLPRLYALLMESEQQQFEAFVQVLVQNREPFVDLLQHELDHNFSADANASMEAATAQRLAYAAIAAYRLGVPELANRVLRATPVPQARTRFIHWAVPFGVEPQALIAQLDRHSEPSLRAALIMALGEVNMRKLSDSQRAEVTGRLLAIYENEIDSGLHAAAEWLLREWTGDEQLAQLDSEPISPPPTETQAIRNTWHIGAEGHTMVALNAEVFQMGVDDTIRPDVVIGRRTPRDRPQQDTWVGRTFAIATKEVTRRQWSRFAKAREEMRRDKSLGAPPKSEACPQSGVSWYDAAAYCNWLSQQEGIPESEWAYLPNQEGKYAAGMTASSRLPVCQGYRLPTEAEWEYACRGGTVTFRPFGIEETFLPKYSWCVSNSENQLQPVGRNKPNDVGCFDMLGNVVEWCHSKSRYYSDDMVVLDTLKPNETISDSSYRLLRGGSYHSSTERLDSADRTWWAAGRQEYSVGFRVARTIASADHDKSYLLWNEAMDLGRRGAWRVAAEKMQRSIEAFPNIPSHYVRASYVWQYLGEFDKANRTRAELIESYGDTETPTVAHEIASAFLFVLREEPREDLAKLCQLSLQRNHSVCNRDTGLLYFRQGKFAEAREWLEKADSEKLRDLSRINTLYFQAMTYHRLGDHAQALRLRQQAEAIFEDHVASSSGGDFGSSWYTWLAVRVIRAEVEEMMGPFEVAEQRAERLLALKSRIRQVWQDAGRFAQQWREAQENVDSVEPQGVGGDTGDTPQ